MAPLNETTMPAKVKRLRVGRPTPRSDLQAYTANPGQALDDQVRARCGNEQAHQPTPTPVSTSPRERRRSRMPPPPPYATAPAAQTPPQDAATETKSVTEPSVAAVSNRANVAAARLENEYHALPMSQARGLDDVADVTTTRLYFSRLRARAGVSADPIEKTLVDNLNLSSLKAAEVFGLATCATDPIIKHKFLNAANRLLQSLCDLTTTLCVYRKSQKPREFPPEFPNFLENDKDGRQSKK